MSKHVHFSALQILVAISSLLLSLSPWAFGVSTKFWSSAMYEDFAAGTFNGVSLNREGTMSLAPQLKEVFSTDQAVVWAAVHDSKGSIYLGTGHGGKVFKLSPDLKGTVFFEAPEPDIFALAVDKDNRVYVGTSPEGKIYRVDASGKSEEFFDPQTRYIWSMIFAADGALYVGTGDRGKIFRVSPSGNGELFYDTKQTHIMTLAVAPNNEMIAGSEPNGLVYRFSAAGKAFVLYDAPLTEIHRVAVSPEGYIYAAALGNPEDRRMRTPQQQSPNREPQLQASTTITVRASQGPGALPGEGTAAPDAEQANKETTPAEPQMPNLPPSYSAGAPRQEGRGIKSALYRISPDGSVDTLWNSPRENVFDLLPSGNRLLFSTDDKGRIYELMPDRRASLVTQTDEEETTRLLPHQNFVLATTANLGKVFRVGTQPAETGSYQSVVHDTGGVSSWGKIRWRADAASATAVELYTRSGNSGRPDATWSDWSGPYRQQNGDQVTSPPARYVQWKVVLHAANQRSPVLQEVVLPYLPRNQAPTVTELKVTARAEKTTGSGAQPVNNPVVFRGSSSGYATALRPAPQKGFDVSWVGADPDRDDLTYALYFRGEGEAEWKLLQDQVKQNYFQLDSDALADGKYRLRVVASDGGVNPAGMAKTAEMLSAPFNVDNAPPEVEMSEIKRSNGLATARFRAFDRTSGLTRAEYVLDAELPVPVLCDDGIVDSQEETFTVNLNQLDGREHLLTLRVYDSAGNMGVGKALWKSTGGDGK